jgi:hypothetical protein
VKPDLARLLIVDHYYSLPLKDRPAYLQFLKKNKSRTEGSTWYGLHLAYKEIVHLSCGSN